MKVELTRVRVRPDQSDQVDAWLKMLNDRMDEVLQTLEREQMKLEVIFREIIHGEEFLYWFSVQGDQGLAVNSSPFSIDHEHIAYSEACIDHEYGARDAQAQVVIVPAATAQALGWENPPASATPFERREIIFRRPA